MGVEKIKTLEEKILNLNNKIKLVVEILNQFNEIEKNNPEIWYYNYEKGQYIYMLKELNKDLSDMENQLKEIFDFVENNC